MRMYKHSSFVAMFVSNILPSKELQKPYVLERLAVPKIVKNGR